VGVMLDATASKTNYCTAVPVNGFSSKSQFCCADSSSELCIDAAAFKAKASTGDVRHAAVAVASGHKTLADVSSGSRGSAVSEAASVLNAVFAQSPTHSMVSGDTAYPFSAEANSKCTSCCKFQHSVVASLCEPRAKPNSSGGRITTLDATASKPDRCKAARVNGFSSKSQWCCANSNSESCIDVADFRDKALMADVRHAVVIVVSGRKDRVDSRSGSRSAVVSEEASVLKAVLGIGAAHSMVSGCAIQPFSTETSSKCCAKSGASTLPAADHTSKASTTKPFACHGPSDIVALSSTFCCKFQHSFVASFCEPPKTDDQCIDGFSSKSEFCKSSTAHLGNAVVSVASGRNDLALT